MERPLLRFVHESIRTLIADYGRVETSMEMDVCLGAGELERIGGSTDMLVLGGSNQDGFRLAVKGAEPVVYELYNGKVRDSFPSIYHFILTVGSA